MGQDRSQWVTYFGASPVDSDFQLFCIDMFGGGATYSKNGKLFQPVNIPVGRRAIAGAFSPHDADTGFLLYGPTRWTKTYMEDSGLHPLDASVQGNPFGLWRTTDRGDSWQQIYEVPTGKYLVGDRPAGKTLVAVDPHPSRSDDIYLATYMDGLIRTTDGGVNWESVAFPNRLSKSIEAGKDGSGTKLYVIVGPKMPDHVEGIEPRYAKTPPTDYRARWVLNGGPSDKVLDIIKFPSSDQNDDDLALNNFSGTSYVSGSVEGKLCLTLDGQDDYAAIKEFSYSGTANDAVTVAAWVRTVAQANQAIVSFDSNEFWHLSLGSAGKPRFVVNSSAGQQTLVGSSTVNDGKWHHVAAKFNQGKMEIYVDGFLDAELDAGAGLTFGSSATRFGYLGTGSESSSFGDGLIGPSHYFDGELDDIRFYEKDVSETDIQRMALLMWNTRNICAQGELWRIDIDSTGAVSSVTQVAGDRHDIVDVALSPSDSSSGFAIARGNPGSGRGGLDLYSFSGGGTLAANPIAAANPGADQLNYVYFNPQDSNHLVLTAACDLVDGSLRYSLDGGATWLGLSRQSVNGKVPDFKSFAPKLHLDYPDGSIPTYEKTENQGSNVAFDTHNSSGLYWWMTIHAKTPGYSSDSGATFTPYAYGASQKLPGSMAISTLPSHIVQAMGEYGFVSTRDTGFIWTGSHETNDNDLAVVHEESQLDYPTTGHAYHKLAWSVASDPSDPSNIIGLYAGGPYFVRSNDAGMTWDPILDGLGDTLEPTNKGLVLWHGQNHSIVYAADMKSSDGGITWTGMSYLGEPVYPLAMSTSNGDVLVGHQLIPEGRSGQEAHAGKPEEVDSDFWNMLVSLDAGATWITLPSPAKETVPGLVPATDYHVTQFKGGRFAQTNPSAVAIDPNPSNDPTVGSNKLRLLLAGRSGVYEYVASGLDNVSGVTGDWTVRNAGLASSQFFNKLDPVPWMGFVAFDPRDGQHNIVYAAKTQDPWQLGIWLGDENANRRSIDGQPYQPVYRSLDGGVTWTNLHSASDSELPGHHWLWGMQVGPDGRLYNMSHTGLYLLDPDSQYVDHVYTAAENFAAGELAADPRWSGDDGFSVDPSGAGTVLLSSTEDWKKATNNMTLFANDQYSATITFSFNRQMGSLSGNQSVLAVELKDEVDSSGSGRLAGQFQRLASDSSKYRINFVDQNGAALFLSSGGFDEALLGFDDSSDSISDNLELKLSVSKGVDQSSWV
ncbi:MAG: LamG-like jellyroll fold domain-containing protein, partial [Verrucomicrobiota bacterium]